MAPLENPKHEAFAQGYADGKSGAAAYLAIPGVKCSANAAAVAANRLLRNDKDVSRIEELKSRALKVAEQVEARALERTIEKGFGSKQPRRAGSLAQAAKRSRSIRGRRGASGFRSIRSMSCRPLVGVRAAMPAACWGVRKARPRSLGAGH
jgi:hypothetical protein